MKVIFTLFGISIGFIILLIALGVTIPLDYFRPQIESTASRMLDRDISIQGPLLLNVSLNPSIELQEISLSNPQDWPGTDKLLDIQYGRIQLVLLPLFRGEIQIDELQFQGIELQLISRKDTSTNYQFAFPDHQAGDQDSSPFQLSGIASLRLRDVQIVYRDEAADKQYKLKIDEALSQAPASSPLQLSMRGTFSDKPYSLVLSADSLSELIRGTSTWALSKAQLDIANTVMDISGSLDRSSQALAGQVSIRINGNELNEIGSLLNYPLPELGAFSVASEIRLQSDMIQFDDLKLMALERSAQGTIRYDFKNKTPAALKATISIPEFDTALLNAFQNIGSSTSTPPLSTQADTQYEPEKETEDASPLPDIPWESLKAIDASLNLSIGRLTHNALQLQDINTTVTLANGDLQIPIAFTYDGASSSGRLAVKTSSDTPQVTLSLATDSIAIAPIITALGGDPRFSGQSGSVTLDTRSQGKDIMTLIRSTTLNLQLADTRLDTQAGRMFASKNLSLAIEAGGFFTLSARGEFLERPFDIDARSSPLPEDKKAVSLQLDINACDTKLKLRSSSYSKPEGDLIDYNFAASGNNLCGYLGPLEQFIGRNADFYAVARGRLKNETGSMNIKTLKLGNIVVDANVRLDANADSIPLLTIDVRSDRFDLTPFLADEDTPDSKLPAEDDPPKTQSSSSQAQNAALIDEILKQELLPRFDFFKSANVNFYLKELIVGPGKISEIKLATKMQEKVLTNAPFQASIGGELFTGDLRMDASHATPFVHVELATNNFYLPALFQEFAIDDAPEITADRIELLFEFNGNSLQDILQRSSQTLQITGGKWQLERTIGEPLKIDIQQANYESRPNTPTKINVAGRVDNKPFSITMRENGLFALQSRKLITLAATAKLADTELRLDGKLTRKSKQEVIEVQLRTELSGKRMNSLNDILGLNLPPLGPYRVEGSLTSGKQNTRLHDMLLQIGDSVLKGEINIATTTNESGELNYPVKVTTRLDAQSIQLANFKFNGWSALTSGRDETPLSDQDLADNEAQLANDATPHENKLSSLVNPEIAARVNGTLQLKVQEVLSGTDKLGSGTLIASLNNNTYSLDELQLDIPGGGVSIRGSLQPEKDRIIARLGMRIKQLDYGVLARRAEPDSKLKGLFNLNLELNSEAQSPIGIKENLNGRIQFGVIPEEYKAGVIDLWAVDILTAALPVLMKGNKSEVNCLAGDFSLLDGIMTPEVFILDTSRIHVEGKGTIDLKENSINFHLRPTPKSAHFFSVATPISISGNLFDPDIGVSAANVVATVFRMVTGIVTTPLKKIFMREIDPEGRSACDAAMAWVHEAQ